VAGHLIPAAYHPRQFEPSGRLTDFRGISSTLVGCHQQSTVVVLVVLTLLVVVVPGQAKLPCESNLGKNKKKCISVH